MKKMKERIFSIVLTLVMVVALFAGMAPMDVHAAATQEPTEEELNCILTTVDVTLEVGAQYIQCSQLPEVTSENYKWAYFYYPAPSNMEGYEECVLGLIASVQETIGVKTMSNCKAAHREKYNQLINEIPSNGQIPVSGDGYGLLYIVQIYDYPIDVSDSGYRYYYNKVAMFDVSKGGTVSNGLVGEETTPISITQQPESVTVNIGAKVTFSVTATGDNLTYKWQVAYGSDKEFGDAYGNGNGTATFTTDGTDKDFNGYRYRCIITDENGNSVTSDVATLTLIGAEPPTEIPGVSIAKTADGYKVTGLGAVEEGYRWGYCPYTLREGEDLDGAVTAKLNEHLTDGPWQNEIANSFDESYEITTYTFPGRAPESIDNYDYIEIVKLNENGFPSEVAVLPLPKTEDETGEETGKAIYDTDDMKLYNPKYTYDEETGEFTINLEAPEEGYEYRYSVMKGMAYLYGDKSTVDEENNSNRSDEQGYRRKKSNFEAARKLMDNSFTVQKNDAVFLYYCPADANSYDQTSIKTLICFAQENGSIYGGVDRNGVVFGLEVDKEKLSEIYGENGLIIKPEDYYDCQELLDTLKEAINIPADASYYVGSEGIYTYAEDYREGINPDNIGASNLWQAESIYPGYHLFFGIKLAGPLSENFRTEEQENFYVKVVKNYNYSTGGYSYVYHLCYDLGIVAGDVREVNNINVDFHWEKLRTYKVGDTYFPIDPYIADVGGTGVSGVANFTAYVKADESFLIKKGETNTKYDNTIISSFSDAKIDSANRIITECMDKYDGWLETSFLFYNLGYKVNAQDTYGAYVKLYTDTNDNSIGYWFGECGEDRKYQGTIDCEGVPYITYMVYKNQVEVVFELGTIGEIEQKKGVKYDITLDRTNYADGYVELYTYNSEGNNVDDTRENNATIEMPEGGKVKVFADSEFTVEAEGATISEMQDAGDEGYYYEITNISKDTTVVVNKVTTPVVTAPVITGQPQDVSVQEGQKATFSVTATGDNLSYQWQIDKNDGNGFVDLSGATSASYTISTVDMNCNGFKYQCIVTNAGGSVTTNGVTLTVTEQPSVHTHSLTLVPVKAATCTTAGNKAYYTCSGCDSLFADANGTTITTAEAVKVAALGHDWTGEWTIIKEATVTEDGKKETLCTRGCGQKKVVIIPATGTSDDNGNFEKDAEVEPGAPIDEATLNNAKEELINVGNVFTADEKTQIAYGTDARVWLEISKTDESAIASADKAKMEQEAAKITGDNPTITYFDADLFKQIGRGTKQEITEPGVAMKITITIPDELLSRDKKVSREYKIIRLHEGQVDVIDGTFDVTTGEFTFESDKFSTYAIVYSEKKVDIPVENVQIILPTNTTLTKSGETIQLNVNVSPEDATDKKVTWHSSNPAVATVDSNGKVTAVGNGTVVITATSQNGSKSASVTLTVAIEPIVSDEPKEDITPEQLEKNNLKINEKLKFEQKSNYIKATWGKVRDADGYKVYVQYCGKKFTAKPSKTLVGAKKNSVTIKKINGKKLNLKKNYKFYVVAYKIVDGKEVQLGKSIVAHIVGKKNTKYTNVKKVKVKKSKFTLKVNKTATIKASTVLVEKGKRELTDAHAKEFRYATDNKDVATVSKTGKIKAVGKGKCTIYVYARNGYCKKVSVTVK